MIKLRHEIGDTDKECQELTTRIKVRKILFFSRKGYLNPKVYHGQDIVMAFSPPVVGCWFKKACKRGAHGHPRNPPWLRPWSILRHGIFATCCRLFGLKRLAKGGLTGTPGPPLATPLVYFAFSITQLGD